MNPLNREIFYLPLRKELRGRFGNAYGTQMWTEAGREYAFLLESQPSLKKHRGAMVLPAVSVYRVLLKHGEEAEEILNAYGRRIGKRFAKAVYGITSVPGMPSLIWNHVEAVGDAMSSEKLGYRRQLVSDPPHMYGVNILSCPYHELAKELGCEAASRCICSMDKEYMKGFRGIRYERTTAVSEGAPYCDYRLRKEESK